MWEGRFKKLWHCHPEFLLSLESFSSVAQLCPIFATSWIAARQASLSITNSQSLLKLMSIESVMPSNHLILCRPLLPFPAFNLSQHQGLFKWVSSLNQLAKVLEFQLQHQSFQWIFRTDFLSDGLAGSPCSPRDSQESSPTPQFKSIHSSALSFLYCPTLTSPSAFNLSQHQGLFQWVSFSRQVAKILELLLQHQSFQWIFRTDFL